ncbi:hypothetical protein ACH0C8_15775, partial [Acetobacter lovaniensis]|uniref:hypothetical protein n=1 Tax=Acetobacter lovaniensis TaxID=104100 RepID=UPI0037700308
MLALVSVSLLAWDFKDYHLIRREADAVAIVLSIFILLLALDSQLTARNRAVAPLNAAKLESVTSMCSAHPLLAPFT